MGVPLHFIEYCHKYGKIVISSPGTCLVMLSLTQQTALWVVVFTHVLRYLKRGSGDVGDLDSDSMRAADVDLSTAMCLLAMTGPLAPTGSTLCSIRMRSRNTRTQSLKTLLVYVNTGFHILHL